MWIPCVLFADDINLHMFALGKVISSANIVVVNENA